jgi:hypothetical protein
MLRHFYNTSAKNLMRRNVMRHCNEDSTAILAHGLSKMRADWLLHVQMTD